MDKTLKLALAAGVGYAGFKLYQLNRLASKIVYRVTGVSAIATLKPLYAAIVVKVNITNPTGGRVKVSNTFGTISIGGATVGNFSTGAYEIPKNGSVNINLKVVLKGLASAQAIYAGLTTNRWPVVTIKQTDLIAGFYPKVSTTVVDLAKFKPQAISTNIDSVPTVE
jgi:hypothetical protein